VGDTLQLNLLSMSVVSVFCIVEGSQWGRDRDNEEQAVVELVLLLLLLLLLLLELAFGVWL